VNGLIGQTHQEAIIVTKEEDLEKIDFSRPISLFSQTTKSTEGFYKIKGLIEARAEQFKANDTICRQVSNRDPQLRIFSSRYDVIIFVSGKKSSNGKVLYEVCKSINPRSYFISDEKEIESYWFDNCNSVGICGATSTPMWLMEDVAKAIQGLSLVNA
jgi:4-hydroxy-3-methylbut-2-enyl diphosphate reductase